jgi:transcriptional regulator with XRE-family HTH domain
MPKSSSAPLAAWLQAEMKERGLTQTALSERAGVAVATINDILTKNHIPKIETLFRIAGALDTSHLDILLITGHLRRADTLPGAPQPGQDHHDEDDLEWQLLYEFRKLPANVQPEAVNQIRWIARLSSRPRYRLVGSETDDEP